MNYSRLTNEQLFEWLRSKSRLPKSGLLEIEDRWISFWERVKERIQKANEGLEELYRQIERMERKVSVLEGELRKLQQRQKGLNKRKESDRLRLIQNNLQSVTRQLDERNPKPIIPESQWEAFEEFLIKLKGNSK